MDVIDVIPTSGVPQAMAVAADAQGSLATLCVLAGEPVHDQASDERCVGVARQATALIKSLKKQEDAILLPLKQALTALAAHFNAPRDGLKALVVDRKAAHVEYVQRCEAERQRAIALAAANARARAAEAAAAAEQASQASVAALLAGASPPPVVAVALQSPAEAVAEVRRAQAAVTAAPKGMTITARWSAEIVNVDLIPREYMIPDTTRLNRLARAEKQRYNVPGTRAVNNPTGTMR